MSECNMEIMETWRRVLVDWINAMNINEAPLLNSLPLNDGTLFFRLMKSLTTIQGLDVTMRQRLMKFIQIHQSKCAAGEMFIGDNVDGAYLTSLLLVNSSLSEGLHNFLCSNLHAATKNHVDMYLSSMLSVRDRISKEIIEMVLTQSIENPVKNHQNNPIDLSQRQLNKYENLKIENYTKIDRENQVLSEKLKNCEMEKKKMAEHVTKLQEQLQQSTNEIELLKNKCEKFENKYHNASQYISTYASSIDSINLTVKKLIYERNALKCRLNEITEKSQNNINKIPPCEVVGASSNNDNDENLNNNRLSNKNNIEVRNNNLQKKNGLQILQVRLERLDQRIIDNASNRNNFESINKNTTMSECVAPMKAKRERIHGRECWKIVPYTRPSKEINSNIGKCSKSDTNISNNNDNNYYHDYNDNNINCGKISCNST